MEFDSFLQISLVEETLYFYFKVKHMLLFIRANRPPCPSCEKLAQFAWWKMFYFIFRKPIKVQTHLGSLGEIDGQWRSQNFV